MTQSHSIKEFTKLFIPPLFLLPYRKARNALNRRDRLFRGQSEMFEELAEAASVYGEYGCGESTIWICQNTNLPIFAVDSSLAWKKRVENRADHPERLQVDAIDLGELGEWGRPVGYTKRENIADYLDSIWRHDSKPDFILVDGRFRIACFFQSLLRAEEGAVILFDDYTIRETYRVVEEYCKPFRFHGTQAAFRVGPLTKRREIEAEVQRFYCVAD